MNRDSEALPPDQLQGRPKKLQRRIVKRNILSFLSKHTNSYVHLQDFVTPQQINLLLCRPSRDRGSKQQNREPSLPITWEKPMAEAINEHPPLSTLKKSSNNGENAPLYPRSIGRTLPTVFWEHLFGYIMKYPKERYNIHPIPKA